MPQLQLPSVCLPSLRGLLGCSGGRIWWFKVAHVTGDPLDE